MLYVLCGPSYCGKSTYAEKLKNCIAAHDVNVTIINPDSIREEVFGDAGKQDKGHVIFQIAYNRTEEALARGDIVIFDATSLTPARRKPLVDIARTYKTMVVAITFKELSMAEFVSRYAARERRVPIEVVGKQRQKFVLPTREEGFTRVWEAEEYYAMLC